eukprot:1904593-Alexandrium_andersonii.AAC.1
MEAARSCTPQGSGPCCGLRPGAPRPHRPRVPRLPRRPPRPNGGPDAGGSTGLGLARGEPGQMPAGVGGP